MSTINPEHEDMIVALFPSPIAEAYEGVQETHGPILRFKALAVLAETILQYAGLVAWSEYVAQGAGAQGLDAFVAETRKPSMGEWLRLFRESSESSQTSILSIRLTDKFAPTTIEALADFKAMWAAVREAVSFQIAPEKLAMFVERELKRRQPGKLSLAEFWDNVVNCRNAYAHPEKGVVFSGELCLVVAPALQKALVAFLLMDSVKRALVDFPWAVPAVNGASVAWDADAGVYSLACRLRRQRGKKRTIVISSKKSMRAGSYLVRLSDQSPYIPFEYGSWPEPAATGVNTAGAAGESGGAANVQDGATSANLRAAELYRQRYRGYLLNDGRLDQTETGALADLVDIAGLSADEASAIRAAVDGEPKVVAKLAEAAAVPKEGSPKDATGIAEDGLTPPEAISPARWNPTPRSGGGKWTAGEYLHDLIGRDVSDEVLQAHLRFFELGERLSDAGLVRMEWGRGKTAGTLTLKAVNLSVMTAYSDGPIRPVVWHWGLLGPTVHADVAAHLDRTLGWTRFEAAVKRGDFSQEDIASVLTGPVMDALADWLTSLHECGLREQVSPWSLRMVEGQLGLEAGSLFRELVDSAHRGVDEEWPELAAGPVRNGNGVEPWLRGKRPAGASEGRVGVELMEEWEPGVFVGVLFDGRDHCTDPSEPALGADFVVLVDVSKPEEDDWEGADAFVRRPEWKALVKRLEHAPGRWSVLDQRKQETPNLWHPLHLRLPLATVVAGTGPDDEEQRWQRWRGAAREGIELLCAGGELAAIAKDLEAK